MSPVHHRTRIKICGLTREEDVLAAVAAGADAIGFVFYPPSPRFVSFERAAELARLMEEAGLPFAPIRRPEELYDDAHLRATGGLADIELPDGDKAGCTVQTTLLPITLAGQRLPVRLSPPRLAAHRDELLLGLGYVRAEIDALAQRGVVA